MTTSADVKKLLARARVLRKKTKRFRVTEEEIMQAKKEGRQPKNDDGFTSKERGSISSR